MASGEGQSNLSTSGDAGRDHHEDFGNEYGPLLPTQEELREMEHRRLVGEATNLMLNFARDPKLAKYMSETAFQDVQAQLKATTTSPPKPESKKQYSEKELEEEIDARLARILGAQKQGKKHDRKRKKSTDFPGYLGNDGKGGSFNSSVTEQQAVLETVARVSHEKPKKNDTRAENGTSKAFQIQDVFRVESDNGAEELPTLIDKKDNIFVMSNPKSKYPVLQLDLRFISDMVVVIVSAAVGGIIFACMGQPVITGYLLAGSAIGPGGLSFVSELVQVETVAQFGVVFLLFALGLEFSTSKLRVVRSVAIFGGLLQIILFMCLSGLTALFCGAKTTEGVFVGAFLSISSTAVVLKFLMERNSVNALHGQVTIGTLILQDCCVGLLFALLPVLGGSTGVFHGLASMFRSLLLLALFLTVSMIISRSFVPRFLKLMMRLSSQQTNELYQLAAVAFCLVVAWCSDKLGLSLELGSFVAGVMISTTDFAEHTLQQSDPIFFSAAPMTSGEGQSNPSTSENAGGDHNEDYGNEYGPPLPTQEELREMEHRRLVSEATNMMLNFAKEPNLSKYMTETAFQDVHAQWKACSRATVSQALDRQLVSYS
ncbi:hypothetical protein L7F22_017261 [Adiantum nelumboides]|nr:hypothetical protein [Adiantum nelumboides]